MKPVFFLILVALNACGSDVTDPMDDQIAPDGGSTAISDMGQSDDGPDVGDTNDVRLEEDMTSDSEPDLIEEPEIRCAFDTVNCFPIVLAHGFAADRTLIEFFGVANELEDRGFAVYEAEVAPYNAIEVRAPQLAQEIDAALAQFDASHVNIVAHSMGGLDSRYVISNLGYGDRIASLTTVSTPHRGTNLADLFVDGTLAESNLIEQFLRLLGGGREVADDPDLNAALRDLSKEETKAFNEKYLDDERVQYQSWAGISNVAGISRRKDDEACEDSYWKDQQRNDVMDVLLSPFALLVSEGAGNPHDGLVPVDSAKWGDFRGCIRADHFDEIGQVLDLFPNLITGFYHIDFYESVAQDLAERGL